ncbi:MAG: hypothetical protein E7571_00985 [Ruminococcaceae bacterium]|nr:hypothetical protein [Oscillospiraceae bacterium]
MKKVLSLALALVMTVASLSTAAIVQAANPSTAYEEVSQIKEKAAAYIVANDTYTDYTDVANASALWTLIKAGQNMADKEVTLYTYDDKGEVVDTTTSNVKTEFVKNLKSNLDTNEGKIVITGANWYQDENDNWYSVPYSYEDIAVYGAAILILEEFGYNTTDFEGYDLQKAFADFDVSTVTNPYSYRVAVEAANVVIKSADKANELLADMQQRYYVKGSGINNWGFSCDNTAQMLFAIGNIENTADYVETIADAKRVIRTYTTDEGAFADSVYVTTVNADSTALAMGGFSAVGDPMNARFFYEKLIENFYNASTGAFTTDGADNMYATKDSLLGLIYYQEALETVHDFTAGSQVLLPASLESNGVEMVYCSLCGECYKNTIHGISHVTLAKKSYVYDGKTKKPAVNVIAGTMEDVSSDCYTVTYSNNKNVGTAKATITFKYRYAGTVIREFVINPKGTAVSKLTAAKKGFSVNWKKQATQTTGYQIQYSTNSNFKNAGTVTVKSNKTTSKKIAKLAAKKKYYVRIRTYKTVKGKNYYSAWSKAKTVTTKK